MTHHLIHTRLGPLHVEAEHNFEALRTLGRPDAVAVEALPDGQFEATRYLPTEDAFVSYRAASQTVALNRAFRHARQIAEEVLCKEQ